MDAAESLANQLALRQHGVVFRQQCLRLGMTAKQIEHRLLTRRWRRLHRGVYAVAPFPVGIDGQCLAAVFGCGPRAAVGYRSAVAQWDLRKHVPGPPDVTSPTARDDRKGIRVHWSRQLRPEDVTTRRGVPVTTLARTIVDYADVADADEVEAVTRSAERLHGFDRTLIVPINGRRGTRKLRPPAHFTRGHLEKRLIRLLRQSGLQLPLFNVPWQRFELDAVWPDLGLVLEIDDWETHGDRDAFERDRRRDRALHLAGMRPIRCTWADLTSGAAAFIAELRALGVPPVARG